MPLSSRIGTSSANSDEIVVEARLDQQIEGVAGGGIVGCAIAARRLAREALDPPRALLDLAALRSEGLLVRRQVQVAVMRDLVAPVPQDVFGSRGIAVDHPAGHEAGQRDRRAPRTGRPGAAGRPPGRSACGRSRAADRAPWRRARRARRSSASTSTLNPTAQRAPSGQGGGFLIMAPSAGFSRSALAALAPSPQPH